MVDYKSALGRLAAGYSCIGAVIWLLWPQDFGFLDNPEAWFVLLTALVVWHVAELQRPHLSSNVTHTKNDLSVATELVHAHRTFLRILLNEHNLWSFIEIEIFDDMREILAAKDRGELFFSSSRLQKKLDEVCSALEELSLKVAQDTVSEKVAGRLSIGYKPYERVSQEEYDRLLEESKKADEIASRAWDLLEDLVSDLRSEIPDAFLIEKSL
jgi:hypothetical protein